jgi:sugar lactone lactonase YvrE
MLYLDPMSGRGGLCYEGLHIGGFTLQTDGSFLLFMERGAVKTWREVMLRTIVQELPEARGSRFSDVIATPGGRVLCGTLPTPAENRGALYLLNVFGMLSKVAEGFGCPNGMGFAPDRRLLYFTDSIARAIYCFTYDEAAGLLSDQRVFVHMPDGSTPDGLTVDIQGFVWSAVQGIGCVVRFSPDGEEVGRVSLPARMVTSVTFGGPEYRDLYITTGGGDERAHEGPGAGALYRIREAGQGVPEFFSRIQVEGTSSA